MMNLIRCIQLELFYLSWVEHLRKLNRNTVIIDGREVDCHGIVPTRTEFAEVVAIPRNL